MTKVSLFEFTKLLQIDSDLIISVYFPLQGVSPSHMDSQPIASHPGKCNHYEYIHVSPRYKNKYIVL